MSQADPERIAIRAYFISQKNGGSQPDRDWGWAETYENIENKSPQDTANNMANLTGFRPQPVGQFTVKDGHPPQP